MAQTAIITGITGQDGSYLAEHLIERGYKVVGLTRSPDARLGHNIEHLRGRVEMRFTSYDVLSLVEIFKDVAPTEVYNLTGQSFVSKSWSMVEETVRSAGMIPLHLLEAIVHTNRSIKYFQAASSEIYTPDSNAQKLDESSPIRPYNPYGCSKALAFHSVAAYRLGYNLFAVNGVLYGHESPRRDEAFLSRKIVRGAARIKLGLAHDLMLGNMQICRDWGYAPDYVEAMHLMMQNSKPEDFHICSGKAHSVEQMVQIAFETLELDYRKYVKTDQSLVRRYEPDFVVGSYAKAERVLGWKPKTSFEEMIRLMVRHELETLKAEKAR